MFFCTLFLIFLDSSGTNIRLCVLSFLHKPMFIFVFNHFPLLFRLENLYCFTFVISILALNEPSEVFLFVSSGVFFFKLCCSDLNFPSDLIYAFCFFAETYYLSIPFKRVYPYVLQYFKITALISLTSLSSLLSQCWRDKIDHLCPCKLFVFSFCMLSNFWSYPGHFVYYTVRLWIF